MRNSGAGWGRQGNMKRGGVRFGRGRHRGAHRRREGSYPVRALRKTPSSAACACVGHGWGQWAIGIELGRQWTVNCGGVVGGGLGGQAEGG